MIKIIDHYKNSSLHCLEVTGDDPNFFIEDLKSFFDKETNV